MVWLVFAATAALGVNVGVDFSSTATSPLAHMWRATGWAPPLPVAHYKDYAVQESSWQSHAFIASVPNRGIEYVRIHDLLYLLKVPAGTKPQSLDPKTIDFTDLDAVVDLVVGQHNLSMGFEFMGNLRVGGLDDGPYLFTDWTEAAQIVSWKAMVSEIASHYISIYSKTVVERWRFEPWNEPDHKCNKAMDPAGITCTVDAWIAYYDACAQGLMAVNPNLQIGGPGTGGATLTQPFFTALLSHVEKATAVALASGTAPTTKLDFIQWHEKGVLPTDKIDSHGNKEHKDSNTDLDVQIVELALKTAKTLATTLPMGNEEIDPMGGWNKVEEWRGDASYPAAAARVLNMHLHTIGSLAATASVEMQSVTWGYNANDNGFLNYGDRWFDQRTLNCRFLMNETGTVEVVRKPIISLMAMLSLLGDTALHRDAVTGVGATLNSSMGVLATTRGLPPKGTAKRWEASVLYYSSIGTANTSTPSTTVTLDVKNLPANDAASAVVAHYRIDQTHSNPRATWSEMGGAANPYPTALQFAKLRKSSELVRLSLSPLIPPAPPAEKMVCETCGHVYDPAVDGPVPNTPFDKLPDDWTCPVCGAPKSSYGPAGFAVDGTTQLWAHPAEVITVEVKVPTPSVGLFHICSAPPASAPLPAMVKDVQLRVTPTKDPPTVFIRWGDIDERCIATYMVEWTADNASVVAEANDGTTTWTRINNMQDTIFAAHVDVRNAQLSGCYRVIAKDYFNRTSPAGPVACMNSTRVIE